MNNKMVTHGLKNGYKQASIENDYYHEVRQFLENSNHYEDHYLRRDTTTRELLTNLKHGYYYKKDSYEWSNGVYEFSSGGRRELDYYIINNRYILIFSGSIKTNPKVSALNSYTATEFKQVGRIDKNFIKIGKRQRKCKLKNGKSMVIYDQPIMLFGQTYDDMDYRKEWHYGLLEYEGNNYGDTSTFYFAGEVIF